MYEMNVYNTKVKYKFKFEGMGEYVICEYVICEAVLIVLYKQDL